MRDYPTLHFSDFPTHLYLGLGSLTIWKISAINDVNSNKFISLDVQTIEYQYIYNRIAIKLYQG
jgi:hypothetical protein